MPKSEFGVKSYVCFTEALASCCEPRTKTWTAPWEVWDADWKRNETVSGQCKGKNVDQST
ncbi:hypothetical protein HAX54_002722, partial [Datura stramonium]|nr:hypothetical protein [Datura stramonium]